MSSSSEGRPGKNGTSIEATSVRVSYGRGSGPDALDGFEATLGPGLTGLVGPNGAGKSTFLRVAAGLLATSSGALRLGGLPPGQFVRERGVGYLPEHPILPGHLTVREFLAGLPPYGKAEGVSPGPEEELETVKELLGKPCDTLSLGQRKKVALAAALRGAPPVLLLDEPTNGLDPMAVADLRTTLTVEREKGHTILVSSHHLDELQRIADAYLFVRAGRVVGQWANGAELGGETLEGLYRRLFGGDRG
jgi:Cu-processing system ATP-binding protein